MVYFIDYVYVKICYFGFYDLIIRFIKIVVKIIVYMYIMEEIYVI